MAVDNIEIEIKVPVDEKTFFEIRKKLDAIAKFKKQSKQRDEYFTPFHRNFVDTPRPFEWLSIRDRSGAYTLNYKNFHPEKAEIFTHCDEFETKIENIEQFKKLFSALDFKSLIVVEKERNVYIYKDEFEIALDFVKELGNFIEIEVIKDLGGVDKAREKLFDFAKELGIDISKADNRGYPNLLMKKKGLIN